MHEAYEVSHLFNSAEQIETIAAYNDNLLLGTRQGHLLMYFMEKKSDTQKYGVQLLSYCKNFSKKPIQQIDVISQGKILLCLTDNVLSTYDINGINFPVIATLQQTKGASLFAIDNQSDLSNTEESNCVRLCVAVKRKILVFIGKNGDFKEHVPVLNVPDIPKVMSWGKDFLCVGFKSEYTLFNLSTGKPKDIFPTSSSRSLEPTIVKYSDTQYLLGRDNTSVLVEEANDIVISKTIKWSEAPISVVWDEPYVLGLLQDQIVVQTIQPPLYIQSLQEPTKARLTYRYKQGMIFVASVGQVWCLSAVDISKQCEQLIKDKQFQLAMDLTSISKCSDAEKKQKIHSIKMDYAMELFNSKDYKRSMQEFSNSETDPSEIIKLFPELNNKPDVVNKNAKLKGKDLENALNALITYLLDKRRDVKAKMSKEKELVEGGEGASVSQSEVNLRCWQQQRELIDTTLLKCYLQTNDALIAPLLRVNNCRLDEAEKVLLEHAKFSELIILYQTKGQHAKALQLLKEQAQQPDSSLRGYQMTKNYLQRLGAEHLNLIFKYAEWILRAHPEEGLKIFTEEGPKPSSEEEAPVQRLPRPRVLDFLLREHEALAVPYLEHVLHAWGDREALYHDALVNLYRKRLAERELCPAEARRLGAKLTRFLGSSRHYTPEKVLLHFPADALFEQRAVVLGRLARHDTALAILVHILGDVEKAISYCENVSSSPNSNSQDVYVELMRILLNPDQSIALPGPMANVPRSPRTSEPDLETALSILEKHASKISPLKALSVLPDSVPLSRLKNFLECAIDQQLTTKRRSQVLKGLLYAEHMQVQELKQCHESECIVIHDYDVCPVCKKRFGNQSAFVRYPNGDIVHYKCRY